MLAVLVFYDLEEAQAAMNDPGHEFVSFQVFHDEMTVVNKGPGDYVQIPVTAFYVVVRKKEAA
jgi:hypothetical protein